MNVHHRFPILLAGCLTVLCVSCTVPREGPRDEHLLSVKPAVECAAPYATPPAADEAFLDDLQARIVRFFWEGVFPETGISWDHSENVRGKTAATGFQLAAICIGVERGWITRDQGYERTLQILNSFYDDPNDPDDPRVDGAFGVYWHFVDGRTGNRDPVDCVALCDSADFIAGVVIAAEYFKGTPAGDLAQKLIDQAQWDQFVTRDGSGKPGLLSFGWVPLNVSENYFDTEGLLNMNMAGFVDNSLLVYVLALGSDTHPIPRETWDAYVDSFTMGEYGGYEAVMTGSGALFSRQVPHSFVPFSRKRDRKIDYFLEMANKLLADRAYNMDVNGYPAGLWGLTDCFGMNSYSHGAPPGQTQNDGTIAPTAFVCGLPYTPGPAFDAIHYVMKTFGDRVYGKYGLTSSVNPKNNFVSPFVVGIEAGPMLLLVENYRTGLIWDLFSRSRVMHNFLKRAQMSGVVDDFELPPEAAPYAEWTVEGGSGRVDKAGAQHGRLGLSIDTKDTRVQITGRLTRNDLLQFYYGKYLSVWTRDLAPTRCTAVIDGRRTELPLTGLLTGDGWDHAYYAMPAVASTSTPCEIVLDAEVRGGRPAVDNLSLESVAVLAPPSVLTDVRCVPGEIGETARLQWTAPETPIARYRMLFGASPKQTEARQVEMAALKDAGDRESRLVRVLDGETSVRVAALDSFGHVGPLSEPIPFSANPNPLNTVAYDFSDGSTKGWRCSTTNFALSIVDGPSLQLAYRKDHAWNHVAVEIDPDLVALHRYIRIRVKGRADILGKLWCRDGLEQDMESRSVNSDAEWTTLSFDTQKAAIIVPERDPVRQLLLFVEPGDWEGEGTLWISRIDYADQ